MVSYQRRMPLVRKDQAGYSTFWPRQNIRNCEKLVYSKISSVTWPTFPLLQQTGCKSLNADGPVSISGSKAKTFGYLVSILHLVVILLACCQELEPFIFIYQLFTPINDSKYSLPAVNKDTVQLSNHSSFKFYNIKSLLNTI